MFSIRIFFIFFINIILSFTTYAYTVSISTDNDGAFKKDRDYTSGLFIRWGNRVTDFGYSAEIGSKIWTPTNLRDSIPQGDERPYAGLLYLQGRVYQQYKMTALKGSFMLGTTGPRSGADKGQIFIHRIIGSPKPKGWDNQIANQYVYQAGLEAHQLIARINGQEISLFTHGQIGNFQNQIALGLSYRIGTNLGSHFGSLSSVLNHSVDVEMLDGGYAGYYFFTKFETRYRTKDLTIEGEQLLVSNQLNIKKQQVALSGGFVWFLQNWGASASLTWETKQYQSPKAINNSFANLTLFYRY